MRPLNGKIAAESWKSKPPDPEAMGGSV